MVQKCEPLRPDFTSKLVHVLAFGTPRFYIAPYDKIEHELVNLSSNCDVKSGLSQQDRINAGRYVIPKVAYGKVSVNNLFKLLYINKQDTVSRIFITNFRPTQEHI